MFIETSSSMDQVKPDGTNRLQLESQRMEERLRMLKQLMSVERAQREASSRGEPRWQSGKRGPLTVKKSNNKTDDKQSTKPLKVKILKGNESDHVLKSGPKCGQCDEYKASMMCIECIENYCNICFVKFHHKGSLSKHHVRPLGKGTVKECQPNNKKHSQTGLTTSPSPPPPHKEEKDESSLLKGEYDEAASAAMFQEALKAWRDPTPKQQTNAQHDQQVIASFKSCGVQASTSTSSITDSHTTATVAPNIDFATNSSSCSYFEKLLLKRVKNNPLFYDSINPLVVPHAAEEEEREIQSEIAEECPSIESSTISPYNIFYSNSDTILPSYDSRDIIPPSCAPTVSSCRSVVIEELPSLLSLHEDKIIGEREEKEIVKSVKRNTKPQTVAKKSKKPIITKKLPTTVPKHAPTDHITLNTNQLPLNTNESPLSMANTDQSPLSIANTDQSPPLKQDDSLKLNADCNNTSPLNDTSLSPDPSHIAEPFLNTSEPFLNNTYNIPNSSDQSPIASKGPFSLSTIALNDSVKQTWIKSTHSNTPRDLSCLFMNSVDNNTPSSITAVPSVDSDGESTVDYNSYHSMVPGCVWLPTNSIPMDDDVTSQFDLPPVEELTARHPSTTRVVYESSDSESDNDTIPNIEEEEEEREEEEDEELVRELTSTYNIEEEKGQEEESRVWSRMTIEELIHDFDIFQDQVRQEDDTI